MLANGLKAPSVTQGKVPHITSKVTCLKVFLPAHSGGDQFFLTHGFYSFLHFLHSCWISSFGIRVDLESKLFSKQLTAAFKKKIKPKSNEYHSLLKNKYCSILATVTPMSLHKHHLFLTPLFLQPPLRSSQPFLSSLSRKELYIRALIFFLTSFSNTFKSVQSPPPCGESFGQTAKVQPSLPLRHSSVNLGRAKRKKKKGYDRKDASRLGRRGWKGSRVRINLN